MLNDLILRLRALFKRSAVEREIDEELRFHLERQVQAYEEAGLNHSDALRRARLQFGASTRSKRSIATRWEYGWLTMYGEIYATPFARSAGRRCFLWQ